MTSVTSLDSATDTSGLATDKLFAWSATATGSGTVTITLSGLLALTTTWLEVVQLGAGRERADLQRDLYRHRDRNDGHGPDHLGGAQHRQ